MTLPQEPPSRRRVGAQSGNRNAYKHGFYSRSFTEETKLLSIGARSGLNEEALIKILIKRTSEYLLRHDVSWAGLCLALRLITHAMGRRDRLLHASRMCSDTGKDLSAALDVLERLAEKEV